jgi:hypothetical protein
MEVAAECRYSPNIVEFAEYSFAEIRRNSPKFSENSFAEYSPLPNVPP